MSQRRGKYFGVSIHLKKKIIEQVSNLNQSTPTMRQTSKKSGVTPMRIWILRNKSKSRGVIRSLYVTREKKFMRINWLSRFPRLPGFLSVAASASVPHLTTITVGVRQPATAIKWSYVGQRSGATERTHTIVTSIYHSSILCLCA